jgi:hypothetical protein
MKLLSYVAPQIKALQIAWMWIKQYAWIIFAVSTFVLGYMLFRSVTSEELTKQLDEIRKRYEEELRAIQEANSEQQRKRDENERRLQEALSLLDEKYRKQLADLDASKKVEIDRILSQNNGDPKSLAELLAKTLDLQVKSM